MQCKNGSENIFFRALSTHDHIKDYRRGIRNSYHTSVPGEWRNKWYKEEERDPRKYLLEMHGWGKYTESALDRFLDLAKNKYFKISDSWNPIDMKACSELDGWCAFMEPQEALSYGCNSGLAKQTGLDQYVSFIGEYLGSIPESFGGSGVLVSVDKIEGLYNRIEFIKKYNLDGSVCPSIPV